jgi:hypothetical protein
VTTPDFDKEDFTLKELGDFACRRFTNYLDQYLCGGTFPGSLLGLSA